MSEANRSKDWRTDIPEELGGIIGGAVWERDTMGCSCSAVYRLKGIPNSANAYLKVQRRTGFDDLRREKEILDWLCYRLPVPQVLHFSQCGEMQYLLMTENTGRAARDIYDELVATKPLEEDLVFTHGDYCLPNVIVSDSGISGFVDWGRAGVADRYQDLALAARSLKHNAGPRGGEMAALFFHEYGVEDVDVAKVRYYILLDELY